MRFITTDQISEGMLLSKNIYDTNLKLLLRAGNTLSSRYIEKIKELGYQGIYINDDLSHDIEIQDIIFDDLRVEALAKVRDTCFHAYHYSKNNSKHAQEVDKHYNEIMELSNKLIVNIKAQSTEQVNLLDLKIFEDYVVSHNVNVGVLSLYLGNALGLSSVELQRLGVAGLLHDVGKMFLDPKILNKPTKLTDQEHKLINMHSTYSYHYIKESFHIHPSTYLGILYHHERIDGTGYPKNKKGNDIPLYSKIISVCDVYDALTSNRPNRAPLLPSEAIEFLMANCGSSFDLDIVKVFMKKIAPYPKGIEVQLSNKEQGIIVENSKDLALRPAIRIFKDSSGNYFQPKTIYLSDDIHYRNVTIVEVLHGRGKN